MDDDTGQIPTRPLCVCCGWVMDEYAVVSITDGRLPLPCPGDFTICAYCRTLMVFTDDLGLRGATKEEEQKLRAEWASAPRFSSP